VAALTAIGLVLVVASIALVVWQDAVTRRVTSRSLGSLAPGYAATKQGYRAYAGLVADIGLFTISIGLGVAWLIATSIVLFVLGTFIVIFGEVVTYRALKR